MCKSGPGHGAQPCCDGVVPCVCDACRRLHCSSSCCTSRACKPASAATFSPCSCSCISSSNHSSIGAAGSYQMASRCSSMLMYSSTVGLPTCTKDQTAATALEQECSSSTTGSWRTQQDMYNNSSSSSGQGTALLGCTAHTNSSSTQASSNKGVTTAQATATAKQHICSSRALQLGSTRSSSRAQAQCTPGQQLRPLQLTDAACLMRLLLRVGPEHMPTQRALLASSSSSTCILCTTPCRQLERVWLLARLL